MALEYEVGRGFFIVHPDEALQATLKTAGLEETYPVFVVPPKTASDALIPSNEMTIAEVGSKRLPISFNFEDAVPLRGEPGGEIIGYQVGVLTIRKG